MLRLSVVVLAASLVVARADAQSVATRPLTQEDYLKWKSVNGASISNDGRWVVYTLLPQIGEGELVARSTTGGTEHRYGRGYLSRPNRVPSGRPVPIGGTPSITADSRWVLFSIEPSMDSVEQARREKWKPDKQAKTSLGIMDLSNGIVTRIPWVKSFQVPREEGSYVAYLGETDPPKPDSAAARSDSTNPAEPRKMPKQDGAPLIIRDLTSGDEVRVEKVTSYMFAPKGTAIVYVVSRRNGDGDGVFMRKLGDSIGPESALATGAGNYKSVAIDRAGTQVAFVTDRDEYTNAKPRYALHHGKLDGSQAQKVVGSDAIGLDMRVSDRGTVAFTRSGSLLTFGVGSPPADTVPTDSIPDRAVFDLWHYKDDFLQTTQLLNKDYYSAPTYQAAFSPASGQWRRVGSDSARELQVSQNGEVGLAISVAPYVVQGMWGDARRDVFVVDMATGNWKLVRKAMESTGGNPPSPGRVFTSDVSLSPDGKFVMLFEKKRWWSYEVATGKTVDLTGRLPSISFENEIDDHPAQPGPWGIAGWTEGDQKVLINDRWDVWEFDPQARTAPKSLTDGLGRKQRITFRIIDLDADDPFVKTNEPVLFTARAQETMDSGIWRHRIGASGAPEKLIMVPKNVRVMAKARNADQYLVTQETFREFPDLWAGSDFNSLQKLSDANPQQSEYRWGTAQLVRYKSTRGVPLKGVLYKPDGFDPKKKYPMVVGIYEILSNRLHSYETPRSGGGAEINPINYVSKGYVVLRPDIAYTDGEPGMSAYAAVTAAVRSIIDSGFVDPKRVGLTGHSWGGYQDAYIATKTDMFRAIASGAPVGNMSSAYGGIRWSTGFNRSMQYERTQSRIGAPPWERPDLYIANSPIFHADKIKTPILMMHNDNDGGTLVPGDRDLHSPPPARKGSVHDQLQRG